MEIHEDKGSFHKVIQEVREFGHLILDFAPQVTHQPYMYIVSSSSRVPIPPWQTQSASSKHLKSYSVSQFWMHINQPCTAKM